MEATALSEVRSEFPRGLYTQSHKLLFESPSPSAIMSFQKADSRVTYFHYLVPDISPGEKIFEKGEPKYITPEESHVALSVPDDQFQGLDEINSQGIPRNLFDFFVTPHLEQYLAKKYRDREIAVRGTACSIKTGISLTNDSFKINDPVQILESGIEHNKPEVAPMIRFDSNDPKIPFRSLQWLTEHPGQLREQAREEGRSDAAENIFPILLVYDRTKFPEGSTVLPSDPTERAKCILEAIVLDYPLSRVEFSTQ